MFSEFVYTTILRVCVGALGVCCVLPSQASLINICRRCSPAHLRLIDNQRGMVIHAFVCVCYSGPPCTLSDVIAMVQNADPDVRKDMETFLSRVAVPEVHSLTNLCPVD